MAAATQNPAVRSESKSAKKKKAKAESSVEAAPAPVASTPEESSDGSYESPYIKELYKNIRNINKKITNASRVDNVVAENPDLSLDQLVAAKKINADQKAQILKKPSLQASLVQLEEQIAQYKKFDQEYKARAQAEKADLEKTITDRTNKETEEKVDAARREAMASAEQEQRANLLLISQFLRLAAIRRGDDETDTDLDENKALEGILSQVYTGDNVAVNAMVNLVHGTQEPTYNINGGVLTTTYGDLKKATIESAPPFTAEPIQTEESEAVETAEYPVQSDPTISNAGLTELDEPVATSMTNGQESHEVQGIPANSSFGEGGNAAAEANWDNANELTDSHEWVEIPRDAAETDNGITATPAAPSNVQSWADDTPDPVEATPAPPPPQNANDGFHEVQRNRGGNRGDGQQRGRGGRGGGDRGRGGFRGEHRGGRGRGGQRGGARGDRGGARRTEES